MTLTYESDLDWVKLNHLAWYLGRSEVILGHLIPKLSHEHTDTLTGTDRATRPLKR